MAFLNFGDYRPDLALGAPGEDDKLGLASGEENCGLATEATFARTSDKN